MFVSNLDVCQPENPILTVFYVDSTLQAQTIIALPSNFQYKCTLCTFDVHYVDDISRITPTVSGFFR